MLTLYVAGPMTGLPDFNYRAFHDAAAQLRVLGYDVENPAENKPVGPDGEPVATWLAFMRMSLIQIAKSDGIALLPGWENSKGARLELHICGELGLPQRSVSQWIFEADMENRSVTVGEPTDGP